MRRLVGAVDLAAIIAGRAILRNADQAELHLIADPGAMDLRDRVVGDLDAAIGIADGAAAIGISQPVSDVLDRRLAAFADLGGQRLSSRLIETDETQP